MQMREEAMLRKRRLERTKMMIKMEIGEMEEKRRKKMKESYTAKRESSKACCDRSKQTLIVGRGRNVRCSGSSRRSRRRRGF